MKSLNSAILILDFGGQYTQLICRRIRDFGIYCEIKSYQISINEINAINPKGIILSGGPESVFSENSPRPNPKILDLVHPNTLRSNLGRRLGVRIHILLSVSAERA